VVTVLESAHDDVETGARIVVKPDGSSEGSLGDPSVDDAAVLAAKEQLAAQASEIRPLPGDVRAFVEVLEPPLRLLICGAGHDAVPLVKAAAALGWSPVVVDDRPGFLTNDRYPEAAGFVLVDEPDDAAKSATTDERTFVVVMTHNFLRDKAYLRSFLASPVAYIGMLGPAARTQRLLMELTEEGVTVTELDRARIHGPAGLDLGSEGPEEIAGSILSEIVAVRRGRHGGFLKERPGPIHDRPKPGTEAK
jgi:xanthine dehydrogenase accessory factor